MDHLGRYELHTELGRGGMGIVYLGHDPLLERDVAVKVLPPELAHDGAVVQRFLDEARSAARLTHPNIVRILDVGADAGRFYFAMEYVAGHSLGSYLAGRGALAPAEAVKLLEPLARGLDAAHQQGIVHRDVKPDNILLRMTGEPLLVDFGIARAGESRGLTRTGMMIGTPEYMSPEQAAGQPVDHRSDIYSLAAVAYHMLAGRPPFTGETALSVAIAHLQQAPAAPSTWRGDLTARIDAVLLQALAKDPGDRYPSATAFVSALSGVSTTPAAMTVAAEALPHPAAAAVPRQSTLSLAVLAVLTLMIGVVGTVAWYLAGNRPVVTAPAAGWSPPPGPPPVEEVREAVEAGPSDADLAALVDHWLELWSRAAYSQVYDPVRSEYFDLYSAGATLEMGQQPRHGRAAIRAFKESHWPFDWFQVERLDAVALERTQGRITTSFKYRFQSRQGGVAQDSTSLKCLAWQDEGDQWRIVREWTVE